MKAVEITEFGAPDVLKLAERPTPEPKAGEVLIKVSASGVNRPDVFQRKGSYAPPPGISDLPGLEVAGEIVGGTIDEKNNPFGLKIGDRVCALIAGGGYAEYAVAPLGQCLPVPNGLTDVEAASLPETFFTVWSNVFQRAYLGQGGTIPLMNVLQAGFPKSQFMVCGVLGPKSNAHGPNEFLHVPYAKKLTATVAEVIAAAP